MMAVEYLNWLRKNKSDRMSSDIANKYIEEIIRSTNELIQFNFPLIKGDWKETLRHRYMEDVILTYTGLHTIEVSIC